MLLLFSYFIVMSGIVYDVINEPPSMGTVREGNRIKQILILQYRVNGQYIMEGLSAGFLFTLGGLAIILLDWISSQEDFDPQYRYTTIGIALAIIVITYNASIAFLKLKIPGYLQE